MVYEQNKPLMNATLWPRMNGISRSVVLTAGLQTRLQTELVKKQQKQSTYGFNGVENPIHV